MPTADIPVLNPLYVVNNSGFNATLQAVANATANMTANVTANVTVIAAEITDNQMSQVFWLLFGVLALICFSYYAWKQHRMRVLPAKELRAPVSGRERLRLMFKRRPREAKMANALPTPEEPVLDTIDPPVGGAGVQNARPPGVPPKAQPAGLADYGLANLPKPAPVAKPADVSAGEPPKGLASLASSRGGEVLPSETKPAHKRREHVRGKMKMLANIRKNKFCPYCDEAYAAYETRRKHIAREHPEEAAKAAKAKAERIEAQARKKAAREAKK